MLTGAGVPLASGSSAVRIAHCECRQPVLNGQRPLTTAPPSTGRALPPGANTEAMRTRGSANTSSCASSGYIPMFQSIAVRIVVTQPVEGQAEAISASTSYWVARLDS